jgi:hemerythrin
MSAHHEARRAQELVEAIKPILAGEAPHIQGAALADLLAMWLAGHVAVGDPEASQAMRETLLTAHIEAVRDLVPVEYKGLIEPELKRRQH